MGSFVGTSEIVESKEEQSMTQYSKDSNTTIKVDIRGGDLNGYSVEDDLNQLIKAIDLRTSQRISRSTRQMSVEFLHKNTLKKPVRVGISQASGIGISESVTLKQALRRLCISQASEMAAMKRQTKPIGLSGISEAGTIKRLYASVVVQGSESCLSLDEDKGNLVEISLMPESSSSKVSEKTIKHSLAPHVTLKKGAVSSPTVEVSFAGLVTRPKVRDVIADDFAEVESKPSTGLEPGKIGRMNWGSSVSGSNAGSKSSKPSNNPRLIRPTFRNKTVVKKKGKHDLTSSGTSRSCHEFDRVGVVSNKSKLASQKDNASPVSCSTNTKETVTVRNKKGTTSKSDETPSSCNGARVVSSKVNESSRSREKGECSQSSKSSIGDYSSGTSISDESNQSGSSGNGSRPHMSKDVRWTAIHHIEMQNGSIGLRNFKLIKRLGCGDIGTVYLAELTGSECLFALKVMDNEFLVSRKKMLRAQTEREILQMLDHPFLPTLYTHFTTDNLSCLVMEYCPGGDLHVLRQKQPGRSFCEAAARFYVAEVLLALEYLHMLGVVYRDLKPENILVREDGHIMLSDFDLSLRCAVSPTLLRSSSLGTAESGKKLSGPCSESSCIDPLCLQPSWVQVSCFTPRLLSSTAAKTRKLKSEMGTQVSPLPQLVAEPTEARSNSFVGTHEYLAPEIIKGEGHGSSVDWWTFGIFLYELLYGRTPFKGPGNEETLANVISQSLKFPDNPGVGFHARDLIRGLLVKEPENRMGSVKGAAEIKQHSFFEGLNWALIRCASPPETPRPCYDHVIPAVVVKKKEVKCLEFGSHGEDVEFELF